MVISDPDAHPRPSWDVALGILGLVSVFLVTTEFAFVHEPRLSTSLIIYGIDAVFLADLWFGSRRSRRLASEEQGYTDRVGSRYSRRRLSIILLGSLPIDIFFFAATAMPWGISLVLWVRLLRVIRLEMVFAVLRRAERRASTNTAMVRVVRLFVVAGVVLHLLACIWYLMAFVGDFPEDSWPVRVGVVGEGGGMAYLLSLYWVVVTTTTVGFGDIVPKSTEEYIFSLFAIIIGASLFAYFIATGASLLSTLNMSKAAFWSRVDTVESYLRSRKVDPQVGIEVRRYYEYLWDRHRGLGVQSLLGDLPASLRVQVQSELMRDLLPQIPIFSMSPRPLREELLASLTPMVIQPGGYVVRSGEVADGIYFIADGQVEVVSPDDDRVYATLSAGEYFGDLTLLLGERRSASVRARGFVEVFHLSVPDFERIRDDYPELREVLTAASQERSQTVAELVLEGVVL